MLTLFHHPFCPHSRFIRLVLAEYGLPARPVEERTWGGRTDFLILNPAGTTPVLGERVGRRGRAPESSQNTWTKRAGPSWGSAAFCPPPPRPASRCAGS